MAIDWKLVSVTHVPQSRHRHTPTPHRTPLQNHHHNNNHSNNPHPHHYQHHAYKPSETTHKCPNCGHRSRVHNSSSHHTRAPAPPHHNHNHHQQQQQKHRQHDRAKPPSTGVSAACRKWSAFKQASKSTLSSPERNQPQITRLYTHLDPYFAFVSRTHQPGSGAVPEGVSRARVALADLGHALRKLARDAERRRSSRVAGMEGLVRMVAGVREALRGVEERGRGERDTGWCGEGVIRRWSARRFG